MSVSASPTCIHELITLFITPILNNKDLEKDILSRHLWFRILTETEYRRFYHSNYPLNLVDKAAAVLPNVAKYCGKPAFNADYKDYIERKKALVLGHLSIGNGDIMYNVFPVWFKRDKQ
jgi:hypothetical protein